MTMGQKSSLMQSGTKPRMWVLGNPNSQHLTHNPNPEQPIKFQYKTRRKSIESNKLKMADSRYNGGADTSAATSTPLRSKSEPTLVLPEEGIKEKFVYRKRTGRKLKQENTNRFGYEINDVDAFLSKASLEKPANIPVVLAFPSVLYQTRVGGYQEEMSIPLGMVVNAVFKNQTWLYVQTSHGEEGYVSYAACLPLGILPPRSNQPAPCWENSTDVFPKPCGNLTDTEKLSSKSECQGRKCRGRRSRHQPSTIVCGERSVDKLYLRAAAYARNQVNRHTLLVVGCDYLASGRNTLTVLKGDVVALVNADLKDWFWVRARNGAEGFIPADITGHGFL